MPQNIHQQTTMLRTSGQVDEALRLAMKIVKKHPAQSLGWIELASCRALKYDFQRASQAIEKALKFSKGVPGVYLTAANSMTTSGYPTEAIRILRKAIVLHPKDAQLRTILAFALELHHQVEDAEQLVEEVLQDNPHYSKALLLRAVLWKRQDQPEKALGILEQLLANTDESSQTRDVLWRVHSLRIQCLDSLKRYDEATLAFRTTAAFTRQFYSDDISLCNRAWQRQKRAMHCLNEGLSSEQLKVWQGVPPVSDQSLCFLSGHPRSGTTLAGTILSSHRDTVLIDEKDIFYKSAFVSLLKEFPPGTPDVERLQLATEKLLSRHTKSYLQLAENCVGEPIQQKTIIDKHPLHIFSVPGAMRLFPQAQHVVTLRDPRAVALSCLLTTTTLTTYSVNWIDPLATAQAYDEIMGAWRIIEYWNLPQIHTLRYEALVKNQEEVTKKLAAQIDLGWSDDLLNYTNKAKSQAATSPTYEQVTRPIYGSSVEKWRHYENLLEPAMPLLEKAAVRMGY
ncbi:MAG: tetratricopeptide repeat-containing sulfotransferase family protein [Akkermansiaceae bacterium]